MSRISVSRCARQVVVYEYGRCRPLSVVSRSSVSPFVRQVVVVYEYGKRRLQVKARLCGHTEAVLSLAASTAYSLIVSGQSGRRLTHVVMVTDNRLELCYN